MLSLGVAIVGTGFIGPVHVEALRRLGHRVVGILGSTPEKSRTAAAALQIGKAYANYEELLEDSEVQVVHIASPNVAHAQQCRQAILAGKHLVCEKPLAMDSTQTAELVELARTTSCITAVNYNIRFYPLILEARQRIHNGDLGPILHINGSYFQDWLLFPTDYNWRVLASEGGPLRAVADIGTHWLDTVAFITGLEIESVCADLQTVHPVRTRPRGGSETFASVSTQDREDVPIDTEDAGSILIRFHGGARGCLAVSQVMAGRKNSLRFEVGGARASLTWDSEEPNTLRIGHRDRPNEQLIRDPSLLASSVRPYANYPGGHAEGFPDSFKQLYRAIYSDIEHGKSERPLYATFADGHREVRICEAILASHRDRRWVSI